MPKTNPFDIDVVTDGSRSLSTLVTSSDAATDTIRVESDSGDVDIR